MGDETKWKALEAPKPSSERCEFLGLPLKPMQSITPPAVPQDQEYRASIDFNVDEKPVTYTFFSKPSFVASNPCVSGPHLQHSNDMKRFKNVCTIGDLKDLQRIPDEVLIINATCDGGELVARAWCSENAQHAICSHPRRRDLVLFTTTLGIFDGVRSAAQFSATDEVLRVKIEVEKVRLIIWGQSIGLNGSPEQRDDALNVALGEEYLRTAVPGLLVCFNKLFEDSEKLKDRYGLVQRVNQGTGSTCYQLLGHTFSGTYSRYRGGLLEGFKDFKMPWAVSDEKLFRGLVEELKAINSSLNHMLPTIRNQTRVRLHTDIMQSTDMDELRSLIKASGDINDLVSETASLRLEVLFGALGSSQSGPTAPSKNVPARRPVSMLQPTVQTPNTSAAVVPNAPALQSPAAETKQTTVTHTAPPTAQPSKSERLSIRAGPPYDNTGAPVIQKVASAAQIPSFLLWRVNVEDPGQPAQKTESNIMDGIHMPSNLLPWCQRLLEVDPEGDPKYPGWAPASEVDDADTPPKKWARACGTPAVQLDNLSKRWSEIAANGGLGPKWTEEIGHQQVRNLLGPSEVVWLDPREAIKIRHQISDILGSLSREDIFPSFDENAGSIGAVAHRDQIDPSTTYTVVDFLYQLIHAKELTLRLERDKGRWHGGITRRIIYNIIAAGLWMRNLETKSSNGTFEFLVHTDVRRRQVDAMMSFAEKMKWPYIAEAPKTLNDFMQQGTPVDIRTWDWVAGLALPRSMFPTTLMFGLHQACPTLNKIAPAGTV
ncbi:hypothetical protein VE03_03016 [Pseudogymnoascus sp. 23342-1-I1]|nr:hypothetical protein VE03_03016 [Pseudogymnoascus sp. 23342-1-I1]